MQPEHCTRCDGVQSRRSQDFLRPCTLKSGDPCDACTILKTLDDDLDEAEKRVEELRQRRENLVTTAVNASHDLLVRMLPTEIIVMIFECYLASHECVLSLGWICQAWRRIAWGTPKLWAHIAIELQPSSLEDDLYFLTTYITRSGTLPLSISLYAKAAEDSAMADYAPYFPFLDALKQCSHRWKSLELEFPFRLLDYFKAPHGALSSTPMLQELAIYPIYGSDASWDEGSFSLGPNKPSPARLLFGQMAPKRIDVDWSRVFEVEVIGIYLQEAFELLECGPNIDHCDIGIYFSESDFSFLSALATSATTHRLRTLRFALGCMEEENIQLFFANVTLPCLEHLEIAGIYKSSLLVDTVISFLGRSSCPLTSLDIDRLGFSGEDLTRLLRTTPLLKELGANPQPPACLDPFFELLNEKTDELGYRFLPLLNTLNLKGTVSSWDPVVALCLQEDCDQSRKRPLSVVNVTGPDLKEGQRPPALSRQALPPAFLLSGGGTSIHFDGGKYSGRMVFS